MVSLLGLYFLKYKFIVFSFFTLIDICEINSKNYDWIINNLLLFGIIAILVRIIAWFLFNFIGVDIFHDLVYEAGTNGLEM